MTPLARPLRPPSSSSSCLRLDCTKCTILLLNLCIILYILNSSTQRFNTRTRTTLSSSSSSSEHDDDAQSNSAPVAGESHAWTSFWPDEIENEDNDDAINLISVIHEAEHNNNKDEVDITHVYPAYVPKDETAKRELDAVFESWVNAAKVAKEKRGIRVEILGAAFPEDVVAVNVKIEGVRLASPLTHRAPGPNGEKIFPTIGQVFERGVKEGRGRLLVMTNADIGAFPNFYVKLVDLDRSDPANAEINVRALKSTFEFWKLCYARSPSAVGTKVSLQDWGMMCASDAQQIFENRGGCPGALDASLISALEKVVKSTEKNLPKDLMDRVVSVAAAQQAIQQQKPLAATITRLDLLDVVPKDMLNVSKIATWKNVARHPGNDCFLVRREAVPEQILVWGHPVGFRPWGWWIPDALKETSRFRRISGNTFDRWTFHVSKGKWGGSSDDFRARSLENPSWVAYLAGGWFAATRGKFGEAFRSTPEWCSEALFEAHLSFCLTSSPSYCQGIAPLSCTGVRPKSRDSAIYQRICSSKSPKLFSNVLTREPACSFCRFVLQNAKRNTSQLVCTDLHMEECSNVDCVSYKPDWPGLLPKYVV